MYKTSVKKKKGNLSFFFLLDCKDFSPTGFEKKTIKSLLWGCWSHQDLEVTPCFEWVPPQDHWTTED